MINIIRKTITVVLSVMVVAGVLAVAGIVTLTFKNDVMLTTVNGSAMSPAAPSGSLAFSVATPSDDITNGDIVAINNSRTKENVTVVGRVVAKNVDNESFYYRLQSDNNVLPNDWVYKTNDTTYKMLFAVPVIGALMSFFSTVLGATVLIASTVLLACVYVFIMHKRKEKQATEDEETESMSPQEALELILSQPSTNSRKAKKNV